MKYLKMNKLFSYLIVVICLFPPFCFAAENKDTKAIHALKINSVYKNHLLTLNDAFKAALIRSETLATQQELVTQAEENYNRAWGSILPNIRDSEILLLWMQQRLL